MISILFLNFFLLATMLLQLNWELTLSCPFWIYFVCVLEGLCSCLLCVRVSLRGLWENVEGKYISCWGWLTFALGDEVADDWEEGDEEGSKRKWGLDVPSITISKDDEGMGGTAVYPLIELWPDELPELPLLVNGGRGTVIFSWICCWFIGVIAIFITGGDVEADVAADAETLEPAMFIMWGVGSLADLTFIPLWGDLFPTFAARRIILLASSVFMSTA